MTAGGPVTLLVATTNAKKLGELQALLSTLPLKLVCLKDLPPTEEVAEDGKTFADNAILKAVGYAKQTGMLTLAEDSGLCCDALEGAPGVYSARFSGAEGNDDKNNEKVLRLLDAVPDNCRGAHFSSAIAIADPTDVIGGVEGEVYGVIARERRGENGFGYDPIFYYPPFERTFGEVPVEKKHEVSHRAKALEKAKSLLETYLAESPS
ncbi:MAG: RdgB/HAM1 family non-canonical purine NTP pyrophosphatase [Candidatus Omnitrophota bacterium]|nr:RdgB/HAM1 family non-canonical purine NTP pyrophosphatase [Candidatus Omnitrophota bacterium]